MKIWHILTILISKSVFIVLKIFGKGSGTALPGLISEKLSPDLFSVLSSQIPNTILITGTNGKTTTQSFLVNIFKQANIPYIANTSGSNMKRGLLSTMLRHISLNRKLNVKYAIFEVEEATLPKIINFLHPKIIIVTNLYRDQLDAYGEIDRTQKFILDSIKKSPQSTVILNADDPKVSLLTQNTTNPTYYYGLNQKYLNKFKYEGKSNNRFFDTSRANNIKILDDLTTSFEFQGYEIKIQTPGIFHVYNAVAAILCGKILDFKLNFIKSAIENTKPAFGRGEIIKYKDYKFKLLLVKNPAGLNLTFDLLQNTKKAKLIMILNDKIADGRDVSWIWDADFDKLNLIKPSLIICAGTRRWDLLLRIKYTFGLLQKSQNNNDDFQIFNSTKAKIIYIDNISKILCDCLEHFMKNEIIYVLPTYTAMLEFRKLITGKAIN